MDLREAAVKLQELKAGLDRLAAGLRPAVEPDHVVHGIELGHAALARSFLGVLLIDNPAGEAGTVWALLESRAPAALIMHPAVQNQREYLSRPLCGTPTEFLTRIKVLNENHPWGQLARALRD